MRSSTTEISHSKSPVCDETRICKADIQQHWTIPVHGPLPLLWSDKRMDHYGFLLTSGTSSTQFFLHTIDDLLDQLGRSRYSRCCCQILANQSWCWITGKDCLHQPPGLVWVQGNVVRLISQVLSGLNPSQVLILWTSTLMMCTSSLIPWRSTCNILVMWWIDSKVSNWSWSPASVISFTKIWSILGISSHHDPNLHELQQSNSFQSLNQWPKCVSFLD